MISGRCSYINKSSSATRRMKRESYNRRSYPNRNINPNSQHNPSYCIKQDIPKPLPPPNLQHWTLILDKPKTSYYIKLYLPEWLVPLINKITKDDLLRCDFSGYQWIGLDGSVFDFNVEDIIQFITNQASIQRGSHIIIYTLPLDMNPFTIEGYHLVFQYDYTLGSIV